MKPQILRSRSDDHGPAQLTVRLLGPYSVTCDGRAIEIASRKARALLAIVLTRGDLGIARSTVAEWLWGGRAEAQARASLRQALAELRSVLGDHGNALEASKDVVRWRSGGASLDLDWLKAPALSRTTDEQLLACGEFLEGFSLDEPSFEQWLSGERTRLREVLRKILGERMADRIRSRNFDAALALGSKSIMLDPFQEQVQRDVMRVLTQMGRADAALANFERLKADLAQNLGVAPERETEDLAREIRASRRSGAAVTPAMPVLAEKPRDSRPSVVVLPFADLTGEAGHEHLARGLTDDIFDALSRVSELVVVSRQTPSAPDRGPDDTLSTDETAAYRLEGSLRLAGSTLRVSARLLRTASGEQVWSERFDGDLRDIFAFQDEIARAVAVAIQVELTFGDAARLWHGQTKNVNAWQAAVRARAAFNRYTAADNAIAERLLQEAIALDPGYTAAIVDLGICYYWRARFILTADFEESLAAARRQAAIVDRLDPDLPAAHTLRAFLALVDRQYDDAIAHAARATRLWPTDARAHTILGVVQLYGGDVRESAIALREAMRLSPYPESAVYYLLAIGDLWQGRLDSAEDNARRHNQLQLHDPHGLAYEAVIQNSLGRDAEAGRTMEILASAVPSFGLRHLRRSEVYRDSARLEVLTSTLKSLGLRE
jgi:DNA-binding SARP family transcriptional activator